MGNVLSRLINNSPSETILTRGIVYPPRAILLFVLDHASRMCVCVCICVCPRRGLLGNFAASAIHWIWIVRCCRGNFYRGASSRARRLNYSAFAQQEDKKTGKEKERERESGKGYRRFYDASGNGIPHSRARFSSFFVSARRAGYARGAAYAASSFRIRTFQHVRHVSRLYLRTANARRRCPR